MDSAAAMSPPPWVFVQQMFVRYLTSPDEKNDVQPALARLRSLGNEAAMRSIAVALDDMGRPEVASRVRALINT